MSEDQSASRRRGRLGIVDQVSRLSGDLGDYVRLRAELFLLEAQEAGGHLGKKIALFAAVAFFSLIAYLLILVALIHLLGAYLAKSGDGLLASWIGASLIMAALHLLGAVLAFRLARKPINNTLFQYSKSEWNKDRQWLQTNEKSS